MVRAAGWKKQGVEEALPVKMPVLGLGIANSTDTVTEGNSGTVVEWIGWCIKEITRRYCQHSQCQQWYSPMAI